MAVEIVISTTDQTRLEAALSRLRDVGGDLTRPFARLGLFMGREARARLRARPHDWSRMTTRLNKSITHKVDPARLIVGSNLVYAAIQQLGGVVVPKHGRYLAIPVLPHLQRGAVFPRDLPRESMKYSPAAAITMGSHSWVGPALVRSTEITAPGRKKKDGTPGKARVVGQKGEVMFALVKQVRIKARPYLMFDEKAWEFLSGELEREYQRAVGGGSGGPN